MNVIFSFESVMILSHRQLQSILESREFNVDRLVCEAIMLTHQRKECITLLGPRQIGKTTLAKSFFEEKLGGVYRDLEIKEDREEVGYGSKFFKQHKEQIIILDEIQESESLFAQIKGHIDKQRFMKNKNCKFLLLGSASLDLQRKSVASLTGRVTFIQMTGILLTELIDSLSDHFQSLSDNELYETYKNLTDLLIFRGGMPLSLFASSDEVSIEERMDFIDSYVQRDVEKYGLMVARTTLEDTLTFIAKVNGKQFEIGTFTKRLKTSRQKVQDAISALEQLLLLRAIKPWSVINGRTVEVSKHTKLYIRDTGLLSSLLDIYSPQSLLDSRHIGTVWESFVIESLIGTAQSTGKFRNCYFYRTRDGDSELDFILEFKDGTKWGIEIKYSEPKSLNIGNITAAKTVGVDRRLVIHNGTRSFKISGGFEAMPLHEVLRAILKYQSSLTVLNK